MLGTPMTTWLCVDQNDDNGRGEDIITKLLFWKKMYISNNVIVHSLSRFVLNRFTSAASQ